MDIRNILLLSVLCLSVFVNLYNGARLVARNAQLQACKVDSADKSAVIKVAQMIEAQQAEKLQIAEKEADRLKINNGEMLQKIKAAKIPSNCEKAIQYGLKNITAIDTL